MEWSQETSRGSVIFWSDKEDEVAILSFPYSSRVNWEKLDVISEFHFGGDWSSILDLFTFHSGLERGPIAEIARRTKELDVLAEFDKSTDDLLEDNPALHKEYLKKLMLKQAQKLADEKFEEISSALSAVNLDELSEEQLAEAVGLINWEDLFNDNSEERWFVPDLLCEGRGHGLPASAGIGKSLLCLDMAAGLAAGKSVLGYPAQDPIRVLYLDHENTPKGDIKPRLLAMGYEPNDLSNLSYLSFPNIPALNTRLGGKTMIHYLEHFTPDLVFIDTFSRFVEGDENGAAVAHNFYQFVGRELKKRNIAYLRIDHVGKDASKGSRGSSAKVDDLDLIWVMSKTKKSDEFLLKNEKARVPVGAAKYIIKRNTSPLSHKIQGGIEWADLIASHLKFEMTIGLIEEQVGSFPNQALGQSAIWSALSKKCKDAGISRSELFEALKFFKGESLPMDDE
jgi:hypothetical protein